MVICDVLITMGHSRMPRRCSNTWWLGWHNNVLLEFHQPVEMVLESMGDLKADEELRDICK